MKKVQVSYGRLMWEFMEIANLVERKNHDYGDAWQRFGIFTPLIRINDKILRIATLEKIGTALVADEKIEDTLKDIVGYAMLALLYLHENAKDEAVALVRGEIADGVYIDEADYKIVKGEEDAKQLNFTDMPDISGWGIDLSDDTMDRLKKLKTAKEQLIQENKFQRPTDRTTE